MWPPSSEDSLFACRTVAIAFQRTIERKRRSSAASPGMGSWRATGIVLTYGVTPLNGTYAPEMAARSTTRESRSRARSRPSWATTASNASTHSRVSCGSTSGGGAVPCGSVPTPYVERTRVGTPGAPVAAAARRAPGRARGPASREPDDGPAPDAEARAWFAAHALSDGVDAIATWAARDTLPARRARSATPIGAGSAAVAAAGVLGVHGGEG